MDSKQWSPSNSGANRGRTSRRRSAGGARWSAAFSCLGVGAASAAAAAWGRGRPAAEARHESRADEEEERPAAEMSAGDELRMEKARILSMVWSVTDDAPADGNRQRGRVPLFFFCFVWNCWFLLWRALAVAVAVAFGVRARLLVAALPPRAWRWGF